MDTVEVFWWIVLMAGWFGLLLVGSAIYHIGAWIHRKWRRSRSRVITW